MLKTPVARAFLELQTNETDWASLPKEVRDVIDPHLTFEAVRIFLLPWPVDVPLAEGQKVVFSQIYLIDEVEVVEVERAYEKSSGVTLFYSVDAQHERHKFNVLTLIDLADEGFSFDEGGKHSLESVLLEAGIVPSRDREKYRLQLLSQ